VARGEEGKHGGIYEIMAGGRRATSPTIGVSVVAHTRYGGIALHAWPARRSKETNRFTFVPVATNASVQSTRVILPRVHCLRIRRCVSRVAPSLSSRASERVGPSRWIDR